MKRRINAFAWGLVVGYIYFRIEEYNRRLAEVRREWRIAMGTLRAMTGKAPEPTPASRKVGRLGRLRGRHGA